MSQKREAISYLFFGVITTIINILCYVVLTKFFNVDYKIATTIAWIVAVIFAFITNKLYVFKSHKKNLITVLKEFLTFTFFRVISYLLDISTMILFVELLKWNDTIAKIIANVIVIAANYFASKYVIFKKEVKNL